MAKKLRIASWFYISLRITAVAVAAFVPFGIYACMVEIKPEHGGETPDVQSFLQLMVHQRQRRERPAHKVCPRELLQQYPDCTVVSFRAGLLLGPQNKLRPSPGQNSIFVNKALEAHNLPSGNRIILGWKPVMQKTPSACPSEEGKLVSLVHHINLVMYRGAKLESGRLYADSDLAMHRLRAAAGDSNEDISTLVASHDRGAGAYMLPHGYGIYANDPITLQYHYLFPKCWDHEKKSMMENTGMDLFMTNTAPRYPAALIGALNRNMFVQQGQGAVDVVTSFDPVHLQHTLFPSLKSSNQAATAGSSVLNVGSTQDGPELLAVHLHTHALTQSKFFQIMNADGSLLFKSQKEKAGYGRKEQSFMNIADLGWPQLKLKPGQKLQQHCQMDTEHLDHSVRFGLDWGDEMCAPLLVIGGQENKSPDTLISGDLCSVVKLGRMLKSFIGDVAWDVGRLAFGS